LQTYKVTNLCYKNSR